MRTASTTSARVGIAAGLILLLGRVLAARGDAFAPFRFATDVFAGRSTYRWETPPGSIVVIGFAVHFTLSLFYGLVYFWIHRAWTGDEMPPLRGRAIFGVLYGALVWLIDFHLFAPLLRPGLVVGPAYVEGVLHVFFFGVPLALLTGIAERRARLFRSAR